MFSLLQLSQLSYSPRSPHLPPPLQQSATLESSLYPYSINTQPHHTIPSASTSERVFHCRGEHSSALIRTHSLLFSIFYGQSPSPRRAEEPLPWPHRMGGPLTILSSVTEPPVRPSFMKCAHLWALSPYTLGALTFRVCPCVLPHSSFPQCPHTFTATCFPQSCPASHMSHSLLASLSPVSRLS